VADYRAAGAPVTALTVVNEPKASTGYSPSMAMSADQQARLVGTLLRPGLDAAGLRSVAVLGYDHNWDDTTYPTAELTGPYAGAFAGAAFHCYGGDESAQSTVAAAAPGKQVWTTECSGGTWSPDFQTNLRWNARHMLVGAFRNLSTASLWFNLALDPSGGPTNGGCTTCRGVLTIDPATGAVTRNVEYWLLAQFGRGVRPGAVRVDSTASNPTGVQSVAFANPDGSHALVLYNEGGSAQPVTVRWSGKVARVRVASGAVATLHW
jgi:glucosylceramidase